MQKDTFVLPNAKKPFVIIQNRRQMFPSDGTISDEGLICAGHYIFSINPEIIL